MSSLLLKLLLSFLALVSSVLQSLQQLLRCVGSPQFGLKRIRSIPLGSLVNTVRLLQEHSSYEFLLSSFISSFTVNLFYHIMFLTFFARLINLCSNQSPFIKNRLYPQ